MIFLYFISFGVLLALFASIVTKAAQAKRKDWWVPIAFILLVIGEQIAIYQNREALALVLFAWTVILVIGYILWRQGILDKWLR